MRFHKRFEVLFRKSGRLVCVAEYNSMDELNDYLYKYPLSDGYTYDVIDHGSGYAE